MSQPEFTLRNALFSFLVLAATPVGAASLDGRWFLEKDGADVCLRTDWADDVTLTISGNTWDFSEGRCVVSAQTGPVSLACITEGSEWQSTANVTLSDGRLIISSEGTSVYRELAP